MLTQVYRLVTLYGVGSLLRGRYFIIAKRLALHLDRNHDYSYILLGDNPYMIEEEDGYNLLYRNYFFKPRQLVAVKKTKPKVILKLKRD